MNFKKWLTTLIDEKGIEKDHIFTVDGASGPNYIPLECLLEAMFAAPKHEQQGIKNMLVRIDFQNASVLDYLTHLARAIAI